MALGISQLQAVEKVFLNPTGKPALKVLAQLNDLFQIGGAVPYLAIRKAEPGREPMIVVRCNETGEERSTRVPATDLTEDQAKDHPEAKKELEEFAKERLLKLQSKHAPETIRYSTTQDRTAKNVSSALNGARRRRGTFAGRLI
jgi:hypothetical protein